MIMFVIGIIVLIVGVVFAVRAFAEEVVPFAVGGLGVALLLGGGLIGASCIYAQDAGEVIVLKLSLIHI